MKHQYSTEKFMMDAPKGLFTYLNKDDGYGYRDEKYIGPLSLYFRPNENWQVGISQVGYYFNKGENDNDIEEYNLSLKSIWSRKNKIKINEKHTSYSYFVDNLYSGGTILVNNELRLNRFTISRVEQVVMSTVTREYPENRNEFESNIVYGVTDDFNLRLDFTYANEILKTISNYNDVNTTSHETKYFRPAFTAKIIIGYLSPFYLSGSINNQYSKSNDHWQSKTYDNLYEDDFSPSDFQLWSSGFDLNLSFVTKGEFESGIILDDFQNYYHRMPFAKQLVVSLGYNYLDNKLITQSPLDYESNLNLSIDYGLSNFLRIKTESYYRYYSYFVNESYDIDDNYIPSHMEYYESLDIFFILSFKNYEYKSSNKNWESLDKYDLSFGEMLKAKQFFFEMNCLAIDYYFNTNKYFNYPYDYQDYDLDVSFFELRDLSRSYRTNISFYLSFGLGKGTVISGHHQRYYVTDENREYDLRLYEYFFSFEIEKRLYERVQVSLNWSKEYMTYNDSYKLVGMLQFLL